MAGLASNMASIFRTSRIALSTSARDKTPLPLGSNSLNKALRFAFDSASLCIGNFALIAVQSISAIV